jgi:NSS family neurotransmitter:Na+ symporter
MPNLVIWVNLGRIAVIGVLIVGYIQSYKAIKNKYKYEIDGIVEFS